MRRRLSFLFCVVLLGGCRTDAPLQAPTPITELSTVFRYPLALWDQGAQGRTTLMVHVTDAGRVDTAYVAVPSGYAAFDSASLAGVRDVSFAPAQRGDRRVAAWVRLPVDFSLPRPGLGQKAERKP
jgi:TonB family protein